MKSVIKIQSSGIAHQCAIMQKDAMLMQVEIGRERGGLAHSSENKAS